MAGSYNHLIGEDGRISFALIENMRDARECIDELFWMLNKANELYAEALEIPEPVAMERLHDDYCIEARRNGTMPSLRLTGLTPVEVDFKRLDEETI